MVVNYIREAQIAAGIPRAQVYDFTMYILAGMLLVGFICNLFVKPVDPKWYMSEQEVAEMQAKTAASSAMITTGSFGIGKGGLDSRALLAWAIVGIPIAWGVWITLSKSLVLFR